MSKAINVTGGGDFTRPGGSFGRWQGGAVAREQGAGGRRPAGRSLHGGKEDRAAGRRQRRPRQARGVLAARDGLPPSRVLKHRRRGSSSIGIAPRRRLGRCARARFGSPALMGPALFCGRGADTSQHLLRRRLAAVAAWRALVPGDLPFTDAILDPTTRQVGTQRGLNKLGFFLIICQFF